MIIKLAADQFTEDNGAYYSPGFMQDTKDTMITVAMWLTGEAEVVMESSIDQVNWVEVAGSSFNCDRIGLQTYVECHHGIAYRIKTSGVPEQAWILA